MFHLLVCHTFIVLTIIFMCPLEYHPMENISLPLMHQRPPNLPTAAWNPWIDMRSRDDINVFNISFPWGTIPGRSLSFTLYLNLTWLKQKHVAYSLFTDYWAKKVKQSYYASVSYVDHLVGKLLGNLSELGLRNNTIILLTSDHGALIFDIFFFLKLKVFFLFKYIFVSFFLK